MATTGRREFLISKGWVAGGRPGRPLRLLRPRPARLPHLPGEAAGPGAGRRRAAARSLFTGEDVSEGQQVFLAQRAHGVRVGVRARRLPRPRLHRRLPAPLRPTRVRESYGGARSDAAVHATIEDFRTNRYDEQRGHAHVQRRRRPPPSAGSSPLLQRVLLRPDDRARPSARGDHRSRRELRQLTAFFAWTAWAAAAERPGHDYSYTNNWPPEPRVDNKPTANVIVWSVLSLIALLGGIGLLFAAFGRWGRNLGWHGREQATLSFRAPGDVALTPAQRATAWFFFVMAALFLIQTFVGAASQHYRAEIASFFGIDLAQVFPYNLMRTWHVQLAIFWVATSFVAAGIFLAPMIARREPRHQGKLAFALLGALAVVVFGTLIGSFLGIHGVLEVDRLELVRPAGLRVPRPRPPLAGPALDRARHLGGHALARAAPAPGERAPRQHAVALLPRRLRDPRLLRGRPDRPHGRQLHRSPSSGASGSSTSGSRTSSSSSRP